MSEDDAELLPRLLAGEEEAYRRLVSTHHRAMIGFARAFVGGGAAEEVVQEAWIKVIAGLPGFERRSSLRLWLFRIVRNAAISRLRTEARAPESVRIDDEPVADVYAPDGSWRTPPAAWSVDTPEALLAAKEMRGIIEKTVEQMPAMQRTVLVLKDVEGLSFDEICNVLEITASNVRVLLHRARRRVWSAIGEFERK